MKAITCQHPMRFAAAAVLVLAGLLAGVGCSGDREGDLVSPTAHELGSQLKVSKNLGLSNHTIALGGYGYDGVATRSPVFFAEPGGTVDDRPIWMWVDIWRLGVPVTLDPSQIRLYLGRYGETDACGHTHYRTAFSSDVEGRYEFYFGSNLRLSGDYGELDYYVRVADGPVPEYVESDHTHPPIPQGRITWRNPDLDGDGDVDLQDAGIFNGYLSSQDLRGDFSCNGVLNLQDAGFMSGSIGHDCVWAD